jgi:two-component system, OmpR family, sensor histidine kinase TctE
VKIFQREQRSLFGEILDWMLTPLLLLWPISLVLTWLVAQGIASKPFDRALAFNAQALAQLVTVQNNRAQFNLPQPAREILRADDSDLVYYQVLGLKGEHLSGEKDMPMPSEDERMELGTVKLRDDQMRGLDVRIAYVYVSGDADVPNSLPAATTTSAAAATSAATTTATAATTKLATGKPVLVQVAETLEKRSTLATEIVKGVMLPQFVIFPLAVFLVWLALVRGIKPLSELEDRIRARKPDDLSAIDAKTVPFEVVPLVASINDLLARQKLASAAQKRFLADAAHQLKTPLAGLRMQAELALREGAHEEDLKQSLKQVSRSSIRATHTVNQLLALARAEASGQTVPTQVCDMARLTVEVVKDCLPRAMEKRIDLGYEGVPVGGHNDLANHHTPQSDALITGNPTLLKEMVRNLIDNAINYTDSSAERPGVVTARVLTDPFGSVVVVQVEDNGPGIAPSERDLVLQPFYRTLGQDADGSGLGLAIVSEIAQQHQATLTMEDAHPRAQPPGVRFTLRFQKAAPGAA